MTHDLRDARRQAVRDSGGAREQRDLDNLFSLCRRKLNATIEFCKSSTPDGRVECGHILSAARRRLADLIADEARGTLGGEGRYSYFHIWAVYFPQIDDWYRAAKFASARDFAATRARIKAQSGATA